MKKLSCTLLTLTLLLSLGACGDRGGTSSPAASTAPAAQTASAQAPAGGSSTAGEAYDTGNFKVLVPDGWKAFPQHDVFSDDPNAMNPNIIQIGKGAASDMDLYSKPAITVNYAGRGTTMMAPSRDFYDDVEDMADITTGDHVWSAFRCVSMGQKLYMLFEDQGKIQFQAAVTYETDGGSVSLDDADVRAILASIMATNAEDIEAQGGAPSQSATPTTATVDRGWWERDWYGWWSIQNATGIYEPANKIAWDAYAEIEVDNKDVGHLRIWDTGTSKDKPLIFGYCDFVPGASDRDKMVSNKISFFPYGVWNNGDKAAEVDLKPGDWVIDPADSTVSRFPDMIEIKGHYQDPDKAEDAFDYYIYLRPWGTGWDDVRNGDTTGCLYRDMMPLYYDDWYSSLVTLGHTHPPASFQEGIDIINDYIANQNESGSGSADLGDKEGAEGKVPIATLKELLPWAKKLSYSTTYDEIAAKFGAHGQNRKSLFEGKTIYRWWATGEDYIQITFDLHEDGSETWNVTTWSGLN